MNRPADAAPDAFARQAARWAERSGAQGESVRLAARVARALGEALLAGHSCLPLAELGAPIPAPADLLATGIVADADAPGSHPLRIDRQQRLYLYRYFDYERRLANRLAALHARRPDTILPAAVTARLDQLMPPAGDGALDPQRVAVESALRSRLTLISGGPGTGKTSTVVNLLACLLTLQPDARIVLAAPTGKAAARMQQSLRARAERLSPPLRERLPTSASTVHRLLGFDPQTGGFRHHAEAPLVLDVLVVDEASMLDLALATRLCEALPAHARLVLLGDRDQLAAVESGAVFAELSAPAALDGVVRFERQFRFTAESGIGLVAAAIRTGEGDRALALLSAGRPDLRWLPAAGPDEALLEVMLAGYAGYFEALDANLGPTEILDAFERFRVLCALRTGRFGAAQWSEWISRAARTRLDAPGEPGFDSVWYRGRPVMVQRNDPVLQLFNGDVGIALAGPEGELQLAFPAGDGAVRWVSPARLPAHETAFALTVHKSQGSEFDRVAVVLPPEPNAVLTRELLYTAVTRARGEVLLVGPAERIRDAIAAPTRRASGLRDRLREAGVA